MRDSVTIEDVPDAAAAAGLETHFLAMYAHFAAVSGRASLREDAFRLWLGNFGPPAAGKSRLICAARQGGACIGFAEGLLRMPPAYVRPGLIGFVAHIHVAPDWRGQGVATALQERLRAWFVSRGAREAQLQIVQGNTLAEGFWFRQGFRPELLQMRCDLEQ
jgi:GNAT superfamily N-acetyltransferase